MIPILPQTKDFLQKSIQILKSGGVIAHPADTCYGLTGDFTNPHALQSIQQLKGREGKKPMSVMLPLSQKSRVGDYAQLNEFSTQVCQQLFPGPVTLILPKGPSVPKWYFSETDLIGLRIPQDKGTQSLLEAFGGPLITTSANPSGQPVCRSAQEVANVFENDKGLLELILEENWKLGHQPSTVIQILDPEDLSGSSCLRVLRPGPMSEKELHEKLNGLKFQIEP